MAIALTFRDMLCVVRLVLVTLDVFIELDPALEFLIENIEFVKQ